MTSDPDIRMMSVYGAPVSILEARSDNDVDLCPGLVPPRLVTCSNSTTHLTHGVAVITRDSFLHVVAVCCIIVSQLFSSFHRTSHHQTPSVRINLAPTGDSEKRFPASWPIHTTTRWMRTSLTRVRFSLRDIIYSVTSSQSNLLSGANIDMYSCILAVTCQDSNFLITIKSDATILQ